MLTPAARAWALHRCQRHLRCQKTGLLVETAHSILLSSTQYAYRLVKSPGSVTASFDSPCQHLVDTISASVSATIHCHSLKIEASCHRNAAGGCPRFCLHLPAHVEGLRAASAEVIRWTRSWHC